MRLLLALLTVIIAAVAVYAILSRPVATSGETPQLQALKLDGLQLKYEDGTPAVLKGVSFGWNILWPRFYNAEAVRALHEDWGANLFRAAIGVDDLMDDHTGLRGTKTLYKGFLNDPELGYDCLYKVVDAAIECGSYVIVDWHSHVMHTAEAAEFFRTVSAKYGNCPNIIYELYNEPVSDTWADLKAYALELIPIIRENAPDALILMGCPSWDQDIELPAADPIEGYGNIMYTVHFYAASHKQELRDRTERAMAMGLPIFISECAAMECTGDGPLDLESWKQWNDWARERDISVVAWSISDKHESCSMMLPEASDGGLWPAETLREWGQLVKEWLNE